MRGNKKRHRAEAARDHLFRMLQGCKFWLPVLGSVGFIFLETCLSVKCKLLWPRVGREGKRREEKRSKERDVTVDGGCVISTRVKLQSIRFARFCKRLSWWSPSNYIISVSVSDYPITTQRWKIKNKETKANLKALDRTPHHPFLAYGPT
jgi:hypothetical protein